MYENNMGLIRVSLLGLILHHILNNTGLCLSAHSNQGNNVETQIPGNITEDVCSGICRCHGTSVMCLQEDTLTSVPQMMTALIASKVTEM